MTGKRTPPKFEQALEQLEQLVESMENGELDLEESLKAFEQGVKLTQACQKALQNAEQKVEILLAKQADAELEPFDSDD